MLQHAGAGHDGTEPKSRAVYYKKRREIAEGNNPAKMTATKKRKWSSMEKINEKRFG